MMSSYSGRLLLLLLLLLNILQVSHLRGVLKVLFLQVMTQASKVTTFAGARVIDGFATCWHSGENIPKDVA